MDTSFYIDPDIRKAETLPASFYRDEKVFKALKEKVFRRSWHWLGDVELPRGLVTHRELQKPRVDRNRSGACVVGAADHLDLDLLGLGRCRWGSHENGGHGQCEHRQHSRSETQHLAPPGTFSM